MQLRYIMTCGLNHSWKTTFGHQLHQQLSPSIVLDNDVLRLFAQAQYPDLYETTKQYTGEVNTDHYHDNMKRFFLQHMIAYSLANHVHCIHTACHMHRQTREIMIGLARKQWAKIALIYFNIDQDLVFQRAREAIHHKDESLYGKWFMGNLEKMIAEFEHPVPSESDIFLEITQPELFDTYQQELLEKMNSFSF